MELSKALQIAEEAVELFRDVCIEIEVVGSVRRRKDANIKDIELLCRPIMYSPQESLFGASETCEKSRVKQRAEQLVGAGIICPKLNDQGNPECWGEKNLRAIFRGYPLDIFSVFPGQSWGVKMAIYTGPASFSQKLVTTKEKGGFLGFGQRIEAGNLVECGEPLPIPHEYALFEALGMKYIEPRERS